MSLIPDDCERCSAHVRQQGDHLCPSCANFLGRSVRSPFWGAFPNHPDSLLNVGSEASRARMFVGVIDSLLEGKRA